MTVTLAPALVDSTNRDTLRRIRAAWMRGWTCRLPAGFVTVMAADIDAWRGRGLTERAATRVTRAASDRRGVRLSPYECRRIVAEGDA